MVEEINQEIRDFLYQMPKTELHVHIEGTLEAELAWQLLLKYQYIIPESRSFEITKLDKSIVTVDSLKSLQKLYNFESLDDFLCLYNQLGTILQQKEDFTLLVQNYIQKAIENNLKHIEVFFDPQTHTSRGLSFLEVVDGLNEGFDIGRKQGITIYLIACILRDHTIGNKEENGNILQNNPDQVTADPNQFSDPSAWQTLKQIIEYNQNIEERNLPDYYKIIGMGLDNTELNYPPNLFQELYQYASIEGNLLCVAHYGEVGPAQYIQMAINNLNIVRIDHGIQCINDPYLLTLLATPNFNENFDKAYQYPQKMPLTVCPMSNYKLKVYNNPEDHNIGELLDLGIMVTINSDDPAYFGGYVSANYEFLLKYSKPNRQITLADIKRLVENGFLASFLPFQAKQKHLQDINEYFLAQPGFLYKSLVSVEDQQINNEQEEFNQSQINQEIQQQEQQQQFNNNNPEEINQQNAEEEKIQENIQKYQQQDADQLTQSQQEKLCEIKEQNEQSSYNNSSTNQFQQSLRSTQLGGETSNLKYENQQDEIKNQQYMEYLKVIEKKKLFKQQETEIQQLRQVNSSYQYYSPLKYQIEKKN